MISYLRSLSLSLFEWVLPMFTWQIPTQDKVVYLTFDDGPIPEVTPWVLDLLDQYQAKATFFCVADNVRKHSDVYNQIRQRGHAVGNHTFSHLKGWQTPLSTYVADVEKAATFIQSDLFRPPYGRISPKQFFALKSSYTMIMWNVLTRDYNANYSPTAILAHTKRSIKPGCIIVFHDSLKAGKNLKQVLEPTLQFLVQEGYAMHGLTSNLAKNNKNQTVEY